MASVTSPAASETLVRQRPEATPQPFRVSVENYYKMAKVGILRDGKRYELIHGVIYEAQPISPEHNYAVQSLTDQLRTCTGETAVVFSQGPARFGDDSEPQPDILVLRSPAERYRRRHPAPDDILLIIEVAGTTLKTDRTLKLQLYARAGIPEYWILNLAKNSLEVYRKADGEEGRYLEMTTLGEGESAVPVGLEGCGVRWWQ